MSRFSIAPLDPSEPTFEGDQGFIGLNQKIERSKLPPGIAARSQNKRMTNAVACKRAGSIMPAFANTAAYGSILGSALYSDPRGPEQMLIATPTAVWRFTSGGYPQAVALPEGVELSGPIYFTQAFDKVILFRGAAATPLQWNGTANGSFEVIAKKDPDDTSTILIPGAERGIATMNRLLVPVDRTNVAVSDIGDYTSYDPIFSNFPINLGTSDPIVRIYPFTQGSIVVGKTNRTELVSGWTDPAHPENAKLEVLSAEVGTCAWDSWAMVGGDLFFLSKPGGVYAVTQVIQDRLQTEAVPVSDPIEPLIRRINWSAAGGAVAAVHGFYYYLAVPLDGSAVNNALLVYNTVSKNWESCDQWDPAAGMQIDNLIAFDYIGSRRLYAVNHAAGTVHLLEEGKFDDTAAGRFQIADLLETRGYSTEGWSGNSSRDAKRLEITLGTWWPSITVTALNERANDERALHRGPITRDPRKWQQWGRVPYDTTNLSGGHAAAGRQDYSFTLPAGDDDEFDLDGVELEKKQEEILRFAIQQRTRYVSLRLASTQGDCDVSQVAFESAGLNRSVRRAA